MVTTKESNEKLYGLHLAYPVIKKYLHRRLTITQKQFMTGIQLLTKKMMFIQ